MNLTAIALLAIVAAGQEFKIPLNIEKLAAKASETVEVTLDGAMLQLAGKVLSEKRADEAQVKKLIQGLKGVFVRAFEFSSPGQYTQADLESLRSQLRAPEWSRIVGIRSAKGENADVFLRMNVNQIIGLVVIAAEPKELAVVYIDGPIDPAQLTALSGQFGIPKLEGQIRKETTK
ncbi:MAG: DUF4252 domain-containing protein [Bryobacteraceae bacterium]